MKTSKELLTLFGNPFDDAERAKMEDKYCVLWEIPQHIRHEIAALPKKMYVNVLLVEPLIKTFETLIERKLHTEIETYDGCYNVRKQRFASAISRHAFALAIDLNAAKNPLFGKVDWSPEFVAVWREIGWTCGADWRNRPDGMHFQWDKFSSEDLKKAVV